MSNSAGVATAFVDLATFDELAAFLYGGSEALTYFVMAVKKSNWFAQLPVLLRIVSGTANFNSDHAVSVNRSGDYVLAVWFQAQLPQLTIVDTNTPYDNCAIRFCRNVMHNLISNVTLTFNELTVQELDSTWFDMYKIFQVPEDKLVGYNNMIGDIASYTDWMFPRAQLAGQDNNVALGDGSYHALVIPFWFFMDSGVSLMTAALPFNEIKINYTFRAIASLVLLDEGTAAAAGAAAATYNDLASCTINPAATGGAGDNVITATSLTISITNAETWATYAIVHNDERVKIGKAPRDVLIQQVQRVSDAAFTTNAVNATTQVDLRLSHQIIALFWVAALNYHPASLSEYTTVPYMARGYFTATAAGVPADPTQDAGVDPIARTDIVYENTTRVSQQSHYYSILDPFFFANRCPDETGYHMKSYSLNTFEYQPKGSSGFSKLANVSMFHYCSTGAFYAATGACRRVGYAEGAFSTDTILASPNGNNHLVNATSATNNQMTWRLRHRALNWNIGRVAGGSFGLPVL